MAKEPTPPCPIGTSGSVLGTSVTYETMCLDHYPGDGNHQEVDFNGVTGFPIVVTYGENNFVNYIKREPYSPEVEVWTSTRMWVVYDAIDFDDILRNTDPKFRGLYSHKGTPFRQFTKLETACDYAVKIYLKWLRNKIKEIKHGK
jgi:hypothetical protein